LPASLQTLAARPDRPSRDKGADGRDGPISGLAVRRSGRDARTACAPDAAARGRLRAAGAAEEIQGLTGDRDRIAQRLNNVVVHRLFAAGLGLHAALRLVGDHPEARIDHAIGELDRAITDLRDAIFDRVPATAVAHPDGSHG
jgi:signal transduction histidine kinase